MTIDFSNLEYTVTINVFQRGNKYARFNESCIYNCNKCVGFTYDKQELFSDFLMRVRSIVYPFTRIFKDNEQVFNIDWNCANYESVWLHGNEVLLFKAVREVDGDYIYTEITYKAGNI